MPSVFLLTSLLAQCTLKWTEPEMSAVLSHGTEVVKWFQRFSRSNNKIKNFFICVAIGLHEENMSPIKTLHSAYSYLHYCVGENYMTIPNLPFPSLSFSSVAAAHRLKFCCILRRISSSIWSQIVVGFDSSRWWSCILNSTWTSATQHTIDSSNADIPHKLPSDILLFGSEMRFSWFIVNLAGKNSTRKISLPVPLYVYTTNNSRFTAVLLCKVTRIC